MMLSAEPKKCRRPVNRERAAEPAPQSREAPHAERGPERQEIHDRHGGAQPRHAVDAQRRPDARERRERPQSVRAAEVYEVEDAAGAAEAQHPVDAEGAAEPNAVTNPSTRGRNRR